MLSTKHWYLHQAEVATQNYFQFQIFIRLDLKNTNFSNFVSPTVYAGADLGRFLGEGGGKLFYSSPSSCFLLSRKISMLQFNQFQYATREIFTLLPPHPPSPCNLAWVYEIASTFKIKICHPLYTYINIHFFLSLYIVYFLFCLFFYII